MLSKCILERDCQACLSWIKSFTPGQVSIIKRLHNLIHAAKNNNVDVVKTMAITFKTKYSTDSVSAGNRTSITGGADDHQQALIDIVKLKIAIRKLLGVVLLPLEVPIILLYMISLDMESFFFTHLFAAWSDFILKSFKL